MKKPYVLMATVNGQDLPMKHYATWDKAKVAMNRIMNDYNLQLADSYELQGDDVYRMEQYRSWFRIRLEESCAA